MNAEQIERNWLLAQTGELSEEEIGTLHEALDTHPEWAEVSRLNSRLLDEARTALTTEAIAPPLSAVSRDTILDSAAVVMGERRARVRTNPAVATRTWFGLPASQVLALAATLVVACGLGWGMLRFLGSTPGGALAQAPAVEAVVAQEQVELLTERLALDRTEFAASEATVDEMLYDLVLLEETEI